MNWRADNAPLDDESYGSVKQGYSSNMKLMMIVAAFLIVTIGLLLVQPNSLSRDLADVAPIAEELETAGSEPISEVTRSETSLLTVATETRRQDVSKLLRQPIRLDGRRRDIRDLTREVLAKFGYDAPVGDRLHALVVQSLAEGQSDSYIDALLNTSVSRGDIYVPVALLEASGRLNTDALLQELLVQFNQ
jgi:hypothetical protein